jgi:hypothetical protein
MIWQLTSMAVLLSASWIASRGTIRSPCGLLVLKKPTFIAPFDLFEYTRMHFGLSNSGQTFQWTMNRVISDLEGVFCYLDDILVTSPNEQTHRRHLLLLFDRLQQFSLVLNVSMSSATLSWSFWAT